MAETMAVDLTATIRRGAGGLWFVRLAGHGYPAELYIESVDLDELESDGYRIIDPDGYLDEIPFDGSSAPRDTREPESVSELDRDSAGYGW